MAIAPTGNIFKGFEFDGLSSKNYGVYISGEAVFDAPQRAVEMITIPARNGAFAIDQGRFENIEVTYSAGIFADSEIDFAEAVSDLRNYLCSRKGYCRLTDEYNPTEYRMAIYKSGLEVTPTQLKAGKFNITFECKPQRYLMSGEAAVTISNGETIMNPTLFDASPMLEVTGYGNIGINDNTVTVNNVVLGEIQISKSESNVSLPALIYPNVANLNTGDSIYKKVERGLYVQLNMRLIQSSQTISYISAGTVANGSCSVRKNSKNDYTLVVYPAIPTYAKGTEQTTVTTVSLTISVYPSIVYTCVYTVTTKFRSNNNSIAITTAREEGWPPQGVMKYSTLCTVPPFYGDSTKTIRPTPMYIDLEIGEAYGETNGGIISFNNIVSMPTKLPVLDVGINTITVDNTVTDLKIVPRWWKI